jgi:hypothetical protein
LFSSVTLFGLANLRPEREPVARAVVANKSPRVR